MKITAIICTYNEEKHIERCILNIKEICPQIIVVDSFSTDKTVEIAKSLGAEVHFKEYITYSEKLNYAINNLKIQGDWVMRIDADEYMDKKAKEVISAINEENGEIKGFRIKRKIKFLNKNMHDTGMYHLKIWKKGYAICEERWMDERMILISGKQKKIKGLILDESLISLKEWSNKHSNYAVKEALDYFLSQQKLLSNNQLKGKVFGTNEELIRFFKKIYTSFPLFVRPPLLFVYKFILKGGFISGREGIIWCFLQTFWYRFLVDTIIYECKKVCKQTGENEIDYFRVKYGIKVKGYELK